MHTAYLQHKRVSWLRMEGSICFIINVRCLITLLESCRERPSLLAFVVIRPAMAQGHTLGVYLADND